MKVSEAIEKLSSLRNQDEQIAMIVLREEEVKQVVGPLYEHTERLIELVSRPPNISYYNPDIDSHYWYEKKGTFRALLEDGVEYIKKDVEEEKVAESNHRLQEELGLENIILGHGDFEIRPMRVFTKKDLTVKVGFTDHEFHLPAGSLWVDFLKKLDSANARAGDSVFFEGFRLDEETNTLTVHFGS